MALDFMIGRGTVIAYNEDEPPVAANAIYIPLAKVVSLDSLGVDVPDIEGGLLSSTFIPARPGTPTGARSTLTLQFEPGDAGLAKINTWLQTGSPPTTNW